MAPKPLLFLFIGFSFLSLPLSAYAYTDSELTQLYRGATDNDTMNNIVNAINSGKLQCSDLPDNIITVQCPDSAQKIQEEDSKISQILHPDKNQTNSQSSNNLVTSLDYLAVILMIIPVVIILVLIGVIGGGGVSLPKFKQKMILKNHKLQPRKRNNLDSHGTLPKGFEVDDEPSEPTMEIHVGHKILLMLGILKVKHKNA